MPRVGFEVYYVVPGMQTVNVLVHIREHGEYGCAAVSGHDAEAIAPVSKLVQYLSDCCKWSSIAGGLHFNIVDPLVARRSVGLSRTC